MSYLKPSNLTASQKGHLVNFVAKHRRETNGFGEGVRDKDYGSAGALRHLERKGAIYCVREERGPRGGVTRILAPTSDGYRVADYITVNGLKTW